MEEVPVGAWVYVLRLRSGQLYIGATTDIERRWREHVAGSACRTTKLDPPVALVHTEPFPTFAEARQREAQIKRWSRAKREALVAGDAATLKRLAQSHDQASSGSSMPEVLSKGSAVTCASGHAVRKSHQS